MKFVTKMAIVGAAAMIIAMAQPAQAVCGPSLLLQSPGAIYGADGGGSYNGSTDPIFSPNAQGFFWALGVGDPATVGDGSGPGIDNGAFDLSAWQIGSPAYDYLDGTWYNYFASTLTTWAADSRIDNCIIDAADQGLRCTCMLLSDEDPYDGVGYFALLGVGDDQFDNYPFDSLAPVQMAEIPKARITGSVRNPSGRDVTLTINPVLGAGVYVDGDCGGCGTVAYKVYFQEVAEDGAAPVGRKVVGDGWAVLDNHGGSPLGNPVELNAPCASDTDLYVGIQLLTDSGFATNIVGQNTTKVACNPNLADPDGPRPIQQNPRPNRPLSRKPTSGRR